MRDLGVITDGCVLIRDGLIYEVGSPRRVENLAAARGAIEINAGGRVVMPGFVDSHTHLVFPPPGHGASDDESALQAVRTGTGQRIQGRTQKYLECMARHGTTTVEVKTGCRLDFRCEIKLLKVLAALNDRPIGIVPSFLFYPPPGADDGGSAAEYTLQEFLPKLRRRRLSSFADLHWEPAFHRQVLCSQYLQSAQLLGFRTRIHADHCDVAGAIALAVQHGAAGIDHLEHATASGVSALRNSTTVATLLPYTTFCGCLPSPPGRALIDQGTPVALATNFNPRYTPTLNMQTVVALACLRMQLTPEEAICAATINGAHALGCADRVGSLDLGKSADLVILNLSHYADLAQNFGMNLVHMTMKRGRSIYHEGDVSGRTAAS
jgi:imidazolonepropionase